MTCLPSYATHSQRHNATHATLSRQSQRYSATHTTPSQPIPTAQRYQYHALPANHNGTPLPTGRPRHQSPRHSATRTTPPSPPANPNGTVPPTPRPPHQPQRHSDTHTTPSPPITTAQRHPHNTLPTNPNATALPTRRPPHQAASTPARKAVSGTQGVVCTAKAIRTAGSTFSRRRCYRDKRLNIRPRQGCFIPRQENANTL